MTPEELEMLAYRNMEAYFIRPFRANLGIQSRMGTFEPKYTRCCCGLGAAVIGMPCRGQDPTTMGVAKALGITQGQAWAFVFGFDGVLESCQAKLNPEWFDAGRSCWDRCQALLPEGSNHA